MRVLKKMRQTSKTVGTRVSADGLRQLRIRLRDGFGHAGQSTESDSLDRILKAYLGYLQFQRLNNKGSVNIGRVQEMLLEVASLVRAGKLRDRGSELGCFVDGLVHIYRNCFVERDRSGFLRTVVDYADLIDAISREFSSHDHAGAVEQLFLYMNRMFECRHKDWVEVFKYIISMPETVALVQHLKQECFPEITEGVESGVHNLFQIHTDQVAIVQKLEMRERLLEQQMVRLQRSYQNHRMAGLR